MKNDVTNIMLELQNLGNEQIKKIYIKHRTKEPLFGVKTGDLKSIANKIKKDYELSMKLY